MAKWTAKELTDVLHLHIDKAARICRAIIERLEDEGRGDVAEQVKRYVLAPLECLLNDDHEWMARHPLTIERLYDLLDTDD